MILSLKNILKFHEIFRNVHKINGLFPARKLPVLLFYVIYPFIFYSAFKHFCLVSHIHDEND